MLSSTVAPLSLEEEKKVEGEFKELIQAFENLSKAHNKPFKELSEIERNEYKQQSFLILLKLSEMGRNYFHNFEIGLVFYQKKCYFHQYMQDWKLLLDCSESFLIAAKSPLKKNYLSSAYAYKILALTKLERPLEEIKLVKDAFKEELSPPSTAPSQQSTAPSQESIVPPQVAPEKKSKKKKKKSAASKKAAQITAPDPIISEEKTEAIQPEEKKTEKTKHVLRHDDFRIVLQTLITDKDYRDFDVCVTKEEIAAQAELIQDFLFNEFFSHPDKHSFFQVLTELNVTEKLFPNLNSKLSSEKITRILTEEKSGDEIYTRFIFESHQDEFKALWDKYPDYTRHYMAAQDILIRRFTKDCELFKVWEEKQSEKIVANPEKEILTLADLFLNIIEKNFLPAAPTPIVETAPPEPAPVLSEEKREIPESHSSRFRPGIWTERPLTPPPVFLPPPPQFYGPYWIPAQPMPPVAPWAFPQPNLMYTQEHMQSFFNRPIPPREEAPWQRIKASL